MSHFRNGFRYGMRREWDRRYKTAALFVLCIVVAGGCTVWYTNAYNKSSESITLYITEKWVDRHTDEDGFSTTSFIVAGNGEEFQCGQMGRNGKSIFHQLQQHERYEVVVAGLGVFRRDIVAINRHIPKPEPIPILIRENEPESE